MRHYKGNMLLIELIIVILIFSLTQLVVVRVFAAAHDKAVYSTILSEALLTGEDVAERLSREQNPDAALMDMGFVGGGGQYVKSSQEGYDLYVTLAREISTAGELVESTIVARANGTDLYSLPVSCYFPKKEGVLP